MQLKDDFTANIINFVVTFVLLGLGLFGGACITLFFII
jgi:hypothetical protein